MSLKSTYYKNVILSITRGTYKGVYINAKPLYLLAVMSGIEEGVLLGNKLKFDKMLNDLYESTCKKYEPEKAITPFYKPFFHSKGEQYYFIKWKTGIEPPHAAHTPSSKFLRENIEYAALDEDLWDLLQDPETREEYRQAIINHFLK